MSSINMIIRDLSELFAAGIVGKIVVILMVTALPLAAVLARNKNRAAVASLMITLSMWLLWYGYYATDWLANPGMRGIYIFVLMAFVAWMLLITSILRTYVIFTKHKSSHSGPQEDTVRDNNNKKIVFLLMAIALAFTSKSASITKAQSKSPSSDQPKADIVTMHIDFSAPISVREAMSILNDTEPQSLMLHHTYRIGDTVFTGGYAPAKNATVQEVEVDYAKAHTEYIRDAMRIARNDQPDISHGNDTIHDLTEFDNALKTQGVLVDSVNAMLPNSSLSSLSMDTSVRSVSAIDDDIQQTKCKTRDIESIDGLDSMQQNAWWANTGTLTTNQCAPWWDCPVAYRYVYQTFAWTDQQRLNTLQALEGGCPAYEQDAVYYAYDDKTYLGDINYWSSNYTYSYIDTNVLDDPNEPVYTVGFYDLSSLRINRTYSTYIRTNNGNWYDDLGKLYAQELPKLDCDCDSPWCIGLWGGSGEFLVNAWNHSVPGTVSWTH